MGATVVDVVTLSVAFFGSSVESSNGVVCELIVDVGASVVVVVEGCRVDVAVIASVCDVDV